MSSVLSANLMFRIFECAKRLNRPVAGNKVTIIILNENI